jgi:hypothetical protein
MDTQKQKLIDNIETTNNVEKLEMTITMLCFGWVMDDHNTKEYEELITRSQNRLRTLMIIRGESHPLCDLNLKKDKKKIEMSVMMSIIKQVSESEDVDKKIDFLNMISMN